MQSALSVSHLTVVYKDKPVLFNVDVTIPQGVLLGIIGPNGAGKTTFIKSILGLVKPLTGRALILGNPAQTMRHTIAYVPQRATIDWDFPVQVLDVVLMGSYRRLGWFRRPGKAEHAAAQNALAAVGLTDYAHRLIGQLSGGQQQRVFLARALMQQASIYFLDEPFAGVDMATEQTIITILKKLASEGKTVLVVHHDLAKLGEYFNWLLMLNVQKIACGPSRETFVEHNIRATYGRSMT